LINTRHLSTGIQLDSAAVVRNLGSFSLCDKGIDVAVGERMFSGMQDFDFA